MAKIRCRSGGEPHFHGSVDEVRSCSQSRRMPSNRMLDEVNRLGGEVAKARAMNFDECFTYIANLRKGVGGRGGMTVVRPTRGGGLQHLPLPAVVILDIPEGYYALAKPDGQSYEFWRVGVQRSGDDEKVASWRLQAVPRRQANQELKLREVLLINNEGVAPWASIVESQVDQIKKVLKAIMVEGPKMQIIYGRQQGYCGVCGRMLTDPTSVALGIGPICLEDNPHYLETIAELDEE